MKHISEFAPKKKECLIVGKGSSAKDFPYQEYSRFCDIWSCNNAALDIADTVLYFDKNFVEDYGEEVTSYCNLIGLKHGGIDNTCPRCDYYYSMDDITFGDTGFHAIQLTQKFYEKIYLIGIDYECDVDNPNYMNNPREKHNLFRMLKHWNTVLQRYYLVDMDMKKVVNLSQRSMLFLFEKKSINGVLNARNEST